MNEPCNVIYKNAYLQGVRRLEKKSKLLAELDAILGKLVMREIASSNHNHPLTGLYKGYRDLHLSDGDTVLIYKYENNNLIVDLILQNLGTHDEVFPKSKSGREAIKKSLREKLLEELFKSY